MSTAKRGGIARTSHAEVIVDAPLEAVWRVIADVSRTGEWSHECRRAGWLREATTAAPAARFRGRNRSGWLRWSRTCEIVAVNPPHEIAWRTLRTLVLPDSTEWRITLAPEGTATRIVQTYQVTRCPGWYEWIVGLVNPSHADRRSALSDDLRRVGTIAASDARVTAGPAGG